MAATNDKQKAPHITKKDIEAYLALEEQRKSLSRQASDLRKQQDVIEERLLEFVRANGGKDRCVTRSGYRLMIELKNSAISWKTEFVKFAGQSHADELIRAAAVNEILVVRHN